MAELRPFLPVDASTLELETFPTEPEKVVRGAPVTGFGTLGFAFGAEIGVWEMTEGTATDVEVDEVFIVLEGEATVTLHVDGQPDRVIDLHAGSVCRLEGGSQTVWDVPRLLRKVYIVRDERESDA